MKKLLLRAHLLLIFESAMEPRIHSSISTRCCSKHFEQEIAITLERLCSCSAGEEEKHVAVLKNMKLVVGGGNKCFVVGK